MSDEKKVYEEKRVYIYVQEPGQYCMRCPECHEEHDLLWSEFKSSIWCNKCQKDQYLPLDSTDSGVFSGPIMLHTSELLGMRFDRLYIEQDKILVQEVYIDMTDSEDEIVEKIKKGEIELLDGPQYLEYLDKRRKHLESQMSTGLKAEIKDTREQQNDTDDSKVD